MRMRTREEFRFSGANVAEEGPIVLWTIFVVILLLWLLGFSFHIAGGLIHLLLVAALAILILNLVIGRQYAA